MASMSTPSYTDDMQTYISCGAEDQESAVTRLLACIAEVNRLKLNADKTEFIWLGT